MLRYLILMALAAGSLTASDMSIQTYAEAGFGKEQFTWEVHDEDAIIDGFATAEWKNMHTAGLELGLKAYPFEALYGDCLENLWFEIHADWFFSVKRETFNGQFSGIEFFDPPLDVETFRNGYRAGDIAVDIGYDMYLTPCFSFAWVAGLDAKKQHFRNHSGELDVPGQLLDVVDTILLHDFRYEASWRGLWTGLQLDLQLSNCLLFMAAANYHVGRFHGHGHWKLFQNLTDGFDVNTANKIRQNGTFHGYSGKVQVDYAIPYSCWVLTVDCFYRHFIKSCGSDHAKTCETVTLADGTLVSETFRKQKKTYRVESNALIISAGLKYDF